ncbi:hypothetical protein ACSFBM_09960 [Variovorax sp. GB1R11]|uniref:hypothetical protein n=1 Tax=Variovorax sp. GB1R11 TaxID=3443741 RepID=UPI003F47DCDA
MQTHTEVLTRIQRLRRRFVVPAIAVSLLAAACSSLEPPNEFSEALGKKLRTEQPAVVDLATVVARPWDELFVFGPYSGREQNCRTLQLLWFDCRRTFAFDMNENELALVFRVDGKVVRSERHLRINGDFLRRVFPQPIQRSAAKFAVMHAPGVTPDGRRWIDLVYEN